MMNDLSRDAQDDVDADPHAQAAVRGHHIEIRLAVCPSKAQLCTARQELLAFFQSGSHVGVPERSLTYMAQPTLQMLGATMYRAAWPHDGDGSPHILHIQAAAHAFSPLALAPIAYRRLERKRRTGSKYGVAPLWLVLGVTDVRGAWEESMQIMGSGCPAISPFERVVVFDGPQAILWDHGLVSTRDARTVVYGLREAGKI